MARYEYTRHVEAAQWTGDNLDEMKELLKDVVDKDYDGLPCVYLDEMEPYFSNMRGEIVPGYSVLKFYAWGDDQEVDPEKWVVVYDQGDDGEIMHTERFDRNFRKK